MWQGFSKNEIVDHLIINFKNVKFIETKNEADILINFVDGSCYPLTCANSEVRDKVMEALRKRLIRYE